MQICKQLPGKPFSAASSRVERGGGGDSGGGEGEGDGEGKRDSEGKQEIAHVQQALVTLNREMVEIKQTMNDVHQALRTIISILPQQWKEGSQASEAALQSTVGLPAVPDTNGKTDKQSEHVCGNGGLNSSAQLAAGNLDMESMAALQQEVNALKREILRKDKEQVRTNKLLRSNGTDEKGSKWLEVLNRVNELGTPRCMSNEKDEKGSKWLEVLNRVDKLDTNKLEMESQCSVSVSGAASDTQDGMLHTHHRYPFRASDRQISPRSPKTHYDYDKIRRMQAGLDDPEITDQSIKGAAQLILASLSPREVGSLDRELEGKSEYRSFTRLPSNQQSVDDELGRSRFSKDVNDSLSVSTLSSSVIYAAERTFGRQYQNNPFGVSSPFGGQAQLSHDQTTAQLVRSARNRAAASQQMVKVRTLDGKHGVLPGSGKGNMGLLSQESTLGPDVEAELLFSIEIDPGDLILRSGASNAATSVSLLYLI